MKGMVYKKHLGKDRHKLQMAPLVDVVFQLLIFFLVASEVRRAEAAFNTNLPRDGRERRPPERRPLVTARVYLRNIDAAGNAVEVSLDGEVLFGDAFRTLESRLRAAAKIIGPPEDMLVVIDADQTVKLKFIARTIDSAVAAGVPRVVFSLRERTPRRGRPADSPQHSQGRELR